MVPNLTGFLVSRCAVFHIAAYCRSPRPIGPDHLREHPRLEQIVQDMAAREADGAEVVDRGRGRFVEARHVPRRIALPAHAADLFVVMRVAVGADVEPGGFLRAQEDRDRVLVLLAVARIDHGFEEALGPNTAVYQAGRGSEPMIEVGSIVLAEALYIGAVSLVLASRDRKPGRGRFVGRFGPMVMTVGRRDIKRFGGALGSG